jgi:hypothetical protein
MRRVGGWLLVGYTVMLVLVTFGETDRLERPSGTSVDAPVEVVLGREGPP